MGSMIPGKLGTLKPVGSYSKIGNEIPGAIPSSHISSDITKYGSKGGTISAEVLRLIEEDWKNLALDITQLGLSLVGLIEIAEPLQAAADVTNGSIDIARGHPWIVSYSTCWIDFRNRSYRI